MVELELLVRGPTMVDGAAILSVNSMVITDREAFEVNNKKIENK